MVLSLNRGSLKGNKAPFVTPSVRIPLLLEGERVNDLTQKGLKRHIAGFNKNWGRPPFFFFTVVAVRAHALLHTPGELQGSHLWRETHP